MKHTQFKDCSWHFNGPCCGRQKEDTTVCPTEASNKTAAPVPCADPVQCREKSKIESDGRAKSLIDRLKACTKNQTKNQTKPDCITTILTKAVGLRSKPSEPKPYFEALGTLDSLLDVVAAFEKLEKELEEETRKKFEKELEETRNKVCHAWKTTVHQSCLKTCPLVCKSIEKAEDRQMKALTKQGPGLMRGCICDYTVDGRLRSRRRDNCWCDAGAPAAQEPYEMGARQSGPMVVETIPQSQSPPAFMEEEGLPLRAKRYEVPPIQFVDPAPPPTVQSIGMHQTRGKPLVVTGGYEIGTPWIDPNAGLWLPVSWIEGGAAGEEVAKKSFLWGGRKRRSNARVQRHWVKAPFMVNTPKYDEKTKQVTTAFYPQLEATSAGANGQGWN